MYKLLEKSKLISLRPTEANDVDFVLKAESNPENSIYVGQWTKKQHLDAILEEDILHLIIEENKDSKPIGYIIMAGLQNPNRNIEFRRIVITEKGKGFGREALKLVKRLSFNALKAHRLWLDVREHNHRGQYLYKSEGFTEEGQLRECILNKDKFESLIIMSILENEYLARGE